MRSCHHSMRDATNIRTEDIVTAPGRAANLRIDQLRLTRTLHNRGSPIVTSHGGFISLEENHQCPRDKRQVQRTHRCPRHGVRGIQSARCLGLGSRTAPEQEPMEAISNALSNISSAGEHPGTRSIEGEGLYDQRCAMYHNPRQPGIPQRSTLATLNLFPPLLDGTMQTQACAIAAALSINP
jgi:hypothetical protein